MPNKPPNQLNLALPSAVPYNERCPCRVCGGEPNGDHNLEHVLPDGTISMSMEPDLCLECATHLWRAFQYGHTPKWVNWMILRMLRRYPVTSDVVRQYERKKEKPRVQ